MFSKSKKKRKYSSDIFILSFFSFFSLSLLLLATATFFSYTSTKKAEERNFQESIKLSQKLIFRLVKAYNTHIANLYQNLDKDQINRIMVELDQVGENPLEKDLSSVLKVANKENVRISLVDYESLKILWSSKNESLGKYKEVNFPEYAYIYPKLSPEKAQIRFTWIDEKNKLKVIVRKVTSDRKYVWRVFYKASRDKSIDNLIDFLKNTQEYEPLIEKTGMYSSLKHDRHGIDALSLPKNIDSAVVKEECLNLNNCIIWRKIKPRERDYENNFITYVGLKFNNKTLEKKLSEIIENLYLMLGISLFLSLLLSFLLSKVFTDLIYSLLTVIRKIEGDLDSSVEFPKLKVRELNELSNSFKRLLIRFQNKKKKARDLAKENLYIADKERRDISRDLHDSVGQLLVAANFKIHAKEYGEAEKTISTASEELRAIYDELEPRSLDKMSLNRAVEWYLLKFFPKTFLYDINLDQAEFLEPPVRVQIYRMIQESIANVRKHAKSCTFISIVLEKEANDFILHIKNDGVKGPRNDSHGRGLENMALRAETFGGKVFLKDTDKSFEVTIRFRKETKK